MHNPTVAGSGAHSQMQRNRLYGEIENYRLAMMARQAEAKSRRVRLNEAQIATNTRDYVAIYRIRQVLKGLEPQAASI